MVYFKVPLPNYSGNSEETMANFSIENRARYICSLSAIICRNICSCLLCC